MACLSKQVKFLTARKTRQTVKNPNGLSFALPGEAGLGDESKRALICEVFEQEKYWDGGRRRIEVHKYGSEFI